MTLSFKESDMLFRLCRQMDQLMKKLDESYKPCPKCNDTGVLGIEIVNPEGVFSFPKQTYCDCRYPRKRTDLQSNE